MKLQSNVGVYTLSIASSILNIPSKTLLNYENLGLTNVSRSEGGRRLYSQRDLLRVLYIKELLKIGIKTKAMNRFFDLREEVLEESGIDLFEKLFDQKRIEKLKLKIKV